MSGGFGGAPKFPGDVADHLPDRGLPPDRWADRLRHRWPLYVALAVAVPWWVGMMVMAVVYLGSAGWVLALSILLAPLGWYLKVVQLRILFGCDPETGERIGRRDR